MMAEYIEKEALIQSFDCNGGHFVYGTQTVDAIVSRINMQPVVDAVEVVRCKDCVFSRELYKHEKKVYLPTCVGCNKHSSGYYSVIMFGDDFCSHAERRSDNG
jgi:hypothetical protein